MRIEITRGEDSVTVDIDGSSAKLLRLAEATALRLLGDPREDEPKTPIGFAGPLTSTE